MRDKILGGNDMNKKVIGLVLAGMMSLSIVGCGNNDNVVEEKTEIVIENQNVEDFKKKRYIII